MPFLRCINFTFHSCSAVQDEIPVCIVFLIYLFSYCVYVCMYGKGVLLVVYGYVCTTLYTVILQAHKAIPNASHWVLSYPHCCRYGLALLFPSLVSSHVRTFEVAVWMLSCCSLPPLIVLLAVMTATVVIVNTVAVKIQVRKCQLPHQTTLFIHAQPWVAELWLVLRTCTCTCVHGGKCALFVCLLCAGLIYQSHTRQCTSENTDTTGMAPTWLHGMWYKSTIFARGTEEDKEVDHTFKVLLLNVALDKHISKLYVRHPSSRSSCGHI